MIPVEVVTDAFWTNLLSLDVDYAYLYSILNNLSREECVGRGKVRTCFIALGSTT